MPAAPAFTWSNALASAAARHSGDMAIHNVFSDTVSDGSRPGARIAAAGYSFEAWAANIAAGTTNAAGAFGLWRNRTSGHCEAMLGSRGIEIGASCAAGPGADHGADWALDFGEPR